MTRLVSQNKIAPGRKRDGATAVLMVFVLAMIIGMTAFGTEVGRMYALRSEMQNAVDAGAVAANLQMRYDPSDLPAAQAKAEQFIQLNRVGMTETVPSGSITATMGDWDKDTRTFTATNTDPNAVQVSAEQVNEPFFFGRIFGHTTFGAPGAAVASGGANPMDIMMVLDLSGSMSSSGRIEALQNSAPVFVDVIEDITPGHNHVIAVYDQIGVMGLSADPSDYDPVANGHSATLYLSGGSPSDDHHVGVLEADLTRHLTGLKNGTLNSSHLFANKYTGTTGTGGALRDAVHYLVNSGRSEAARAIVLMSDGYANRPTDDGSSYALQMAAYANTNKVKVYTISLGSDADTTLMGQIASATGGQHFDATGSGEATLTAQLTTAFRQAAAAIKRSQLVK